MEQLVVPAPVQVQADPEQSFTVDASTRILVPSGAPEAARVGEQLAAALRGATGHPLPVEEGSSGDGAIALRLDGPGQLGEEGYELEVTRSAVTLRAQAPAGLFRGVQTIRQLLPATAGPWTIPGGRISDQPHFGWRGAMLDVARHFFSVEDVKRYVDLMALYKLNVLHLHLSDDQGWRIDIEGWPRLARHGGSTEVGGGEGGYYTQDEYAGIVRYAAERYITVVPEIDMPGHTNAALASYPELNCDGKARELYTGIEVGFSSLCVDSEVTYDFIDDVIGQLAELTPGPWIHIGGDEVQTLSDADYRRFVERAQAIVEKHGKEAIGWQEVAKAELRPGTVVQYWTPNGSTAALRAAERGTKLILSPASRAYLDQKYDGGTAIGLDWAGHLEVRDSYGWEPASYLKDVPEESILGVEAPLWSETLHDLNDVEYMAFPRLAAIAEVAWTPAGRRDWDDFRQRVAAHGPRWRAMGVSFYESPQIDWPPPS